MSATRVANTNVQLWQAYYDTTATPDPSARVSGTLVVATTPLPTSPPLTTGGLAGAGASADGSSQACVQHPNVFLRGSRSAHSTVQCHDACKQ